MENKEYEKLLKLLLKKVEECETDILVKDFRIQSLEAEVERLTKKTGSKNEMEIR